ncbi:hypothetical protein E3O62_02460 [Cryobacterium sp. TMT2-15-1]|uniref:hypothetical protein n=1 Tax=Cryobacterium sp. TMT2-15-1 TaxID=1259246 RepID=UPI00106D0B5F|nr:hypothetical protein [Cryobacterium sp. TMT2-15-1]TFC63709.1 hypothetical protein E3O62_02460 [Cryobacterium sp. TMT2-15-1]
MPLNLRATRRLSLSGFGIGWDECYLIVKAVSGSEAQESADQIEELKESNDVKGLNKLVRDYCIQNITKGVVINTKDDGSQEPYEFTSDEVSGVVDALNLAWQLEVLAVSTGSDRLKA